MSTEIPWFFVVGAQKAGTTTLHDWLRNCCEVALPWSKETHYFRDEDRFSKGDQWYLKQFKVTAKTKVIGEIDPEYMYFPECAQRIKCFTKNPKLIFILRDPLSRAYSNYLMSVRMGYEPLSFSDALQAEAGRLKGGDRFSRIHHAYIARGLYAKQMRLMLEKFPNAEVKVLFFEELFSSQASAEKGFREICEFIGVGTSDLAVDFEGRANQSSEPRSRMLRDLVYKDGCIKKTLGRLIPSRFLKITLVNYINDLNMRPITSTKSEKSEILANIPEHILELLRRDLEELQQILNIDLSELTGKYSSLIVNKSQEVK